MNKTAYSIVVTDLFECDAGDQMTSTTAPDTTVTDYTYDADGNQTSAGATSYTYDAAGRMITAQVGATTTTYTYSGDGVRLSASTGTDPADITKFLWDRNGSLPVLASERDGSGATLRTYRYGLGLTPTTLVAGASDYFYHTDVLGSVTDLTDASGTSLAWSEYAPFGTIRTAGGADGAPTNPMAFTGAYTDATGLLYLCAARQYDPTSARFLAKDPLPPVIGQPCISTYVYAKNSPLNLLDPSGRESQPAGQTSSSGCADIGQRAGYAIGGTLIAAGSGVGFVLGTVVAAISAAAVTAVIVATPETIGLSDLIGLAPAASGITGGVALASSSVGGVVLGGRMFVGAVTCR